MAKYQIRSFFAAADRWIDKGLSVLIIFGGALITLTVVLQVLLRYVFKVPLFGLEEFSRLIAVWVYFIGAIYGTKMDNHVQGDVADRFFKTPQAKARIKTLVWCLSLLVCILFLYHAGKYSLWIYETGERTTGLWWPRVYSVGSMFFGALLMTFYSIGNVFKYAMLAMTAPDTAEGGALWSSSLR